MAYCGHPDFGSRDLCLYTEMDSNGPDYFYPSWGVSHCVLFSRKTVAETQGNPKPSYPLSFKNAHLRDALRKRDSWDNLLSCHGKLEADDGNYPNLHRNQARMLCLQ